MQSIKNRLYMYSSDEKLFKDLECTNWQEHATKGKARENHVQLLAYTSIYHFSYNIAKPSPINWSLLLKDYPTNMYSSFFLLQGSKWWEFDAWNNTFIYSLHSTMDFISLIIQMRIKQTCWNNKYKHSSISNDSTPKIFKGLTS